MHALMEEVDQLRLGWEEPDLGCSLEWEPSSPRGRGAFEELTSMANREALREWYAGWQGVELNVQAEWLKRWIERRIGELLP